MALAALIVRIGADVTDLNKALSQTDKDIQKLGKKLVSVGKDLSTFVTLPLVALGAVAVRSATQLDSLTRGLTAITGSADETERQLVRLKEVAKLPGLGFKEAIQGSISLQAVGFSAAKAERSLMAFGNAIATTGGGKAELDRVFTQLTQMASAGKILTADLRPIIQVSPLVGRALKEAFGTISAEQINDMGLSFEEFYERLVSQLETLPKVTGGARNSFENLSDASFRLSAAFGEGILPVILPLINKMADLSERFSAMSSSTRTTILVVGGLVAAIGPLLMILGKVMTLLPLIKVGFAALTGPIGLAILAIGAMTAAWIAWQHKQGQALRDATKRLDEYTASLQTLNRQQLMTLSADIVKAQAAWGELPQTMFVQEKIAALEAQLVAVVKVFNALPAAAKKGPPVLLSMEEAAAKLKKELAALSEKADAAVSVFDSLAALGAKSSNVNSALTATYDLVAAKLREMGDNASAARAQLLGLAAAMMENIVVARHFAAMASTGSVGPLAGKTLPGPTLATDSAIQAAVDKMRTGPMAGVEAGVGGADPLFKVGDEIQIQLQKNAARDKQNAEMLQGAIAQSASIIGSTIVSALNIGGGGKGSNLGAALGGTAGSVGGMILGAPGGPIGIAIGSAIGSTVGGLIGSAVGGLFDSNKEAVNQNTSALRMLTATILNAPAGFRVEPYRYRASDPKELAKDFRRYQTRGGAPLLTGV